LADPAPIKLHQAPGTALINLGVAALIVVGLYFGREIFVPLALAVLLSFVLAPFVARLQHWRVPRMLAVLCVVVVGFGIIFSLGGLMVSQAGKLAEELPGYQKTLRDKIESFRGLTAGSGTLERASKVLKDLNAELTNPRSGEAPAAPTPDGSARPPSDKPLVVEVRQPDPGPLSTLVAIIQPLLQPLTTTGIVLIFTIFILLQRQDLRNRLVRLAGSHDIQRTTAALDDAGDRLSKLFLTQLIFNACFGFTVGVGLWLIGVPSAPLWGLVAMIMRFVPYIGALISAVFPLILAAAVGPDWQMLVLTALLFFVIEPLAGQGIEPLLFGRSSGLSPVAVVVAASFWTWLWGPVGLVLATPLTVCLVVVGRHVERLKFLDVMFGDQPPLTPPQLIYQRMLVGDPVEASEQASQFLKTGTLDDYYDTTLLGGLLLAEADRKLGRLDDERINRIVETVQDLTADLETYNESETVAVDADVSGIGHLSNVKAEAGTFQMSPELAAEGAVLCIPGGGKLDEAGALVLAQLLRRRGYGATAETADALSMARIFSLDLSTAKVICLCYLDGPSQAKIDYAVRRLIRKSGEARIVIALLGSKPAAQTETSGRAVISGTFSIMVQSTGEIAQRARPETQNRAAG
jgi:predicted PurR-regulated permease PerM